MLLFLLILSKATVQFNVNDRTTSIYDQISRINAYGSQSHCVVDTLPELRKFCVCNDR